MIIVIELKLLCTCVMSRGTTLIEETYGSKSRCGMAEVSARGRMQVMMISYPNILLRVQKLYFLMKLPLIVIKTDQNSNHRILPLKASYNRAAVTGP